MKTTSHFFIVAIAAVGLLAIMAVASAATHHKTTHHKTTAQTCAAEPGSLSALMCPQPPASSSKHKKA
jgi:hypothetical protein